MQTEMVLRKPWLKMDICKLNRCDDSKKGMSVDEFPKEEKYSEDFIDEMKCIEKEKSEKGGIIK